MKRHQSMIKEADLPGVVERHTQAELAAQVLERHRLERIGIDHFAKPDDALALAARRGRVQRNFQGYTVDPADALLGLGAWPSASCLRDMCRMVGDREPTSARSSAANSPLRAGSRSATTTSFGAR